MRYPTILTNRRVHSEPAVSPPAEHRQQPDNGDRPTTARPPSSAGTDYYYEHHDPQYTDYHLHYTVYTTRSLDTMTRGTILYHYFKRPLPYAQTLALQEKIHQLQLAQRKSSSSNEDVDMDMQRRDHDLDTVHQFFRRIAEVRLSSAYLAHRRTEGADTPWWDRSAPVQPSVRV